MRAAKMLAFESDILPILVLNCVFSSPFLRLFSFPSVLSGRCRVAIFDLFLVPLCRSLVSSTLVSIRSSLFVASCFAWLRYPVRSDITHTSLATATEPSQVSSSPLSRTAVLTMARVTKLLRSSASSCPQASFQAMLPSMTPTLSS